MVSMHTGNVDCPAKNPANTVAAKTLQTIRHVTTSYETNHSSVPYGHKETVPGVTGHPISSYSHTRWST